MCLGSDAVLGCRLVVAGASGAGAGAGAAREGVK